jgi:hypothetical protein
MLNFGNLPPSTIVNHRRPMAGNVLSVKSKSGVVGNVGAAFGIASQLTTSETLFPFRFGGRHLACVVSDVGRHWHLRMQVGRGRKCGGDG